MLPDALGHELFREIRHRHPHLPVLVVTGHAVDSAARQCFDSTRRHPDQAGQPARARALGADALQFDPDRDLVAFDNLGNEWFDS